LRRPGFLAFAALAGITLGHAPRAWAAEPEATPTTTTTAASDPATIASQIIKIVGQSDPPSRRAAAAAVLRVQSPEAVKALLQVFEVANNELAKIAVCEAIADTRIEMPDFVEKIEPLLRGKNAALQKAAAAALAVYSDPGVAARLETYRQQQERVVMAENLERLMDMLHEATTDEGKRTTLLLDWLKSPLTLQRRKALQIVSDALRGKGTKPATEILAQIRGMLTDPDAEVRQKAIGLLRDLGLPEDATRIRALLSGEQTPTIREEIYKALGKLADPISIDACIGGLTEEDDKVAAAAADALGRLCDKSSGRTTDKLQRVVDALLRRMARPIDSALLRRDLVEAMGDIADPRFTPLLIRHAGTDEMEPTIRQAALRGLQRVGDLAGLGIIVDRLINDPDVGVREVAAQALGRLGDQSTHLRALRTRLDRAVELAPSVGTAAWDAYLQVFQKLNPEDQVEALTSWDGNEPDRLVTLAALVQGTKRATVAERLLKHAQTLDASDHAAAVAFLDLLTKSIPDLFGSEWAPRFNAIRTPPATQTAPSPAGHPTTASQPA